MRGLVLKREVVLVDAGLFVGRRVEEGAKMLKVMDDGIW